jgi:hypothetical protein
MTNLPKFVAVSPPATLSALGMPMLHSYVAFAAITSIGVIGLYVSYISECFHALSEVSKIPQAARWSALGVLCSLARPWLRRAPCCHASLICTPHPAPNLTPHVTQITPPPPQSPSRCAC